MLAVTYSYLFQFLIVLLLLIVEAITYHLRDQLILALLELRVIFVPTQCLTSVIGF